MAWIRSILVFALLTVLTQVGGLIYLAYKPVGWYVRKNQPVRWKSRLLRLSSFLTLYLLVTFFLIPPIAGRFGRAPLPWSASETTPIAPRNLFYPLANRHYADPALIDIVKGAGRTLRKSYPELELLYLDAGFPFWDGFRLFPHLSHDDGRKLDLCFIYSDGRSNQPANRTPALLGYGAVEAPRAGEHDQPAQCAGQGYWQYNLLQIITPEFGSENLRFDEAANRQLLQLLARQPRTDKIFIEPHLKQRLRLSNLGKIRYQGCRSVRHDDHIHVQF